MLNINQILKFSIMQVVFSWLLGISSRLCFCSRLWLMDWKAGEAGAKRISVLDWDGLLSGIFYLLGSCQYAKLRNTAFDLLLYSIHPVREEKVTFVCVCVLCEYGLTHGSDVFGAERLRKTISNPAVSSFSGIKKIRNPYMFMYWLNSKSLTNSSFKESLSL